MYTIIRVAQQLREVLPDHVSALPCREGRPARGAECRRFQLIRLGPAQRVEVLSARALSLCQCRRALRILVAYSRLVWGQSVAHMAMRRAERPGDSGSIGGLRALCAMFEWGVSAVTLEAVAVS